MLRISEQRGDEGQPVLRLEGQLVGAWIGELEQNCDRLLRRSRGVVLDLAEVSFIDRRALAVLRDLHARGVIFANSNPFVAEQLKEVVRC
jgi:anti-anti-sigma regulatory factor